MVMKLTRFSLTSCYCDFRSRFKGKLLSGGDAVRWAIGSKIVHLRKGYFKYTDKTEHSINGLGALSAQQALNQHL